MCVFSRFSCSPWCSTEDTLRGKNLDLGWQDAASSWAGRSPLSPRRPWWPRPSRRTRPPSAASRTLPSSPWSPRSPWTLREKLREIFSCSLMLENSLLCWQWMLIPQSVSLCTVSLSSLETLRQINHSLLFSGDPDKTGSGKNIHLHNQPKPKK